jgi:hypothetical protein
LNPPVREASGGEHEGPGYPVTNRFMRGMHEHGPGDEVMDWLNSGAVDQGDGTAQ